MNLSGVVQRNDERCSDNKKEIDSMKKIENIEPTEGGAIVSNVFLEINERENRKTNIVVHNLREPAPSIRNGKEKEEDIDSL